MDEPTRRRLAGQVIVAGFDGTVAPPHVLAALGEQELAGVILFRRNLVDPGQVHDLVGQIVAAAPGPTPLVAIDQEGGRVQRLGPPVLQLPPMRRLGDLDDVELTRRAGAVLGRQLAGLGFNLDLAPVLDVATEPENQVIGDRSFGADPEKVARHGLAFAAGLRDAGLLACGKHFPGHGDTVEDSHLELPALPHEMPRLEAVELVPFSAAAGSVDALMTAHIVFRALDPDRPATLSREVITGLLRERLGYDGLVVSDDLEMKAIADHYTSAKAAVEAIRAGCDLLLICRSRERIEQAREALAAEAGSDARFAERLREAAGRAGAARARIVTRPIGDRAALDRLFDEPAARELASELAERVSSL